MEVPIGFGVLGHSDPPQTLFQPRCFTVTFPAFPYEDGFTCLTNVSQLVQGLGSRMDGQSDYTQAACTLLYKPPSEP